MGPAYRGTAAAGCQPVVVGREGAMQLALVQDRDMHYVLVSPFTTQAPTLNVQQNLRLTCSRGSSGCSCNQAITGTHRCCAAALPAGTPRSLWTRTSTAWLRAGASAAARAWSRQRQTSRRCCRPQPGERRLACSVTCKGCSCFAGDALVVISRQSTPALPPTLYAPVLLGGWGDGRGWHQFILRLQSGHSL